MRIEINACRFAVNKLINKGSQGYMCWNEDDTDFSEISWNEVLKWLDGLEEFYEPGDK